MSQNSMSNYYKQAKASIEEVNDSLLKKLEKTEKENVNIYN
jgi:hypothetical protein